MEQLILKLWIRPESLLDFRYPSTCSLNGCTPLQQPTSDARPQLTGREQTIRHEKNRAIRWKGTSISFSAPKYASVVLSEICENGLEGSQQYQFQIKPGSLTTPVSRTPAQRVFR